MSAALEDEDFYMNVLRYMNQDDRRNVSTFINPMTSSFPTHEAEKHGLDDETTLNELESKRRGACDLVSRET